MHHLCSIRALFARTGMAAMLCFCGASMADEPSTDSAPSATSGDMAHMSGHMFMTQLKPLSAGDKEKADAVVKAARAAMAPYQDYRKALADGFRIFFPKVAQPQYHFTNYKYGREANQHFDPLKPTSLLYKKTPDGGYKLVGVMYTDRVDATEQELNERVPLSFARWHQHVNFCLAPWGQRSAYFGPNAKFGLQGSISTREACNEAGGTFFPHVLGWMVHVYPNEVDEKKIWSTDDDEQGHDNMDHAAMPGMNMEPGMKME